MKILLILIFYPIILLANYKHEILLEQKSRDVIWGFDFPDLSSLLFTERNGKLYHFDLKTKTTQEITGLPQIYAMEQGGLLDLRVHPKNGFIYITYAGPAANNQAATTLARFKILDKKVTHFQKIFEATSNPNPYHFGSRIEFVKEKVFITSGERGDRPSVQKLDNTLGKVIRMNEDGSGVEIWCHGLRNPQGLSVRPGTDELWEAEMGPQGGDEINLIKKDANYGWAVITYGKEYEGPSIGEGTKKKGMEQPVTYWVPSISPSAITFWKGDLWMALLSGEHLRKLTLKGQKVIQQEKFLDSFGWRFRNIRPGPDGNLWFSTDEGRLGRLIPTK
jgi:glucose/arabinose dehydrogenase